MIFCCTVSPIFFYQRAIIQQLMGKDAERHGQTQDRTQGTLRTWGMASGPGKFRIPREHGPQLIKTGSIGNNRD